MGRYYSGDIEGKFWVTVQASDAADRFGVTGTAPEMIEYYFGDADLPGVEEELNNIKESLGEDFDKLDKFFKEHDGYNTEMLIEAGFNEDTINQQLKDYADYYLGVKIRDCIKEQDYCQFEGEL